MAGFMNVRININDIPRRLQEWVSLGDNVLKFNVDGASKVNPGPSGIGGVLRDHHKKVLGYFAKSTGCLLAYEAEVHAILNALVFCHQYNFHDVVIESDSHMAVEWTKQGNMNRRPWRLQNEFNLIDYLQPLVNCLEINHMRSEGNTLADYLANVGCTREVPLWILSDDM